MTVEWIGPEPGRARTTAARGAIGLRSPGCRSADRRCPRRPARGRRELAHAGCRPGDAGPGRSAGSAAQRDGGRLSRRSRPRGFRGSAEHRAARPPAPRAFGAAPRRVHRAARRRASGRIRAAARPAPGLAHRLYRLGRAGDRAAPARGAVCRWPLHLAGGAAGRWEPVRNPPSGRRPATALDRQRPDRRRRARLRPVAAHAARGRAVPHRGRKGRGELARGRRQPARPGLAGSAGRAAGPGGAAPRRICRRGRAFETHPARPRPGRRRRRGGDPDDARIDRLAAQHPRRRRAAHAVAAVLRHPARRRHAHPVRRPPQARPRPRPPSRQCGDRCRARSAGAGARCARRRRRPGAGRSGQCGIVDFRPARGGRGQAPSRRRSVHLAQGVQEQGRGRGHPRGASPRRRGVDPLSRLARAGGARRAASPRSPPATGSKPFAARANISAI